MTGALHGAHGIPGAWRAAVLDSTGYKGGDHGILRPEWLAPTQAPGLVKQLLAQASTAP